MAETEDRKSVVITIKKYANRRLYNTATSSYVTLDHLSQMVKEGVDFVVYDAKTGEDITRAVLTQIIVEEENKGQNLLPISFLRQLIGLYGDSMQWMVPSYLEYSMQVFSRNQERMREYFQTTFGGMFPFGGFEEMSKHNLAMLERTMRMFTPFGGGEFPWFPPDITGGTTGMGVPGLTAPPTAAKTTPREAEKDRAIDELKRQLDELQGKVAELSRQHQERGGA